MLKEQVQQARENLSNFSYPYNRRIAGADGHFSNEDYHEWLKETGTEDLARALRRLAHLINPKTTFSGNVH